MRYALGIDIGSSGLKLSLLGEDGRLTGPYGSELETFFPRPGWAEQNPDDWYEAFRAVLPVALRESGISAADVAVVALDAATHTAVLLDSDNRPVRHAILWNDQRSTRQAQQIEAVYGSMVLQKTFHAPGAMWTLSHLCWVRENEPDIWERTERLLFAKDYLRLRMGGGFVTDRIDAQGSELFNLHTMMWDPELCDIAGVSSQMLPQVLEPTDLAGYISECCAKETGLTAGTPICAGASDTAMEVLAAGAVSPGQGTVKLATSGRICVISDCAYPHEMLVNYSHVVPGLWYPGTGTRSCATSMRWFKDQFCGDERSAASAKGANVYSLISQAAEDVPVGSEGLIYHPYLLGESTPCRNPDLRASFIGASMKHTRAHFARAVMEGTAYSLYDCFLKLEEIGVPLPDTLRIIGGGSASPVWRATVADLFDRELILPAVSDSSAGCAMVAAAGAGMFHDLIEAGKASEAFAAGKNKCGNIEPDPHRGMLLRKYFGFYKDIRENLEPLYNNLATLVSQQNQHE